MSRTVLMSVSGMLTASMIMFVKLGCRDDGNWESLLLFTAVFQLAMSLVMKPRTGPIPWSNKWLVARGLMSMTGLVMLFLLASGTWGVVTCGLGSAHSLMLGAAAFLAHGKWPRILHLLPIVLSVIGAIVMSTTSAIGLEVVLMGVAYASALGIALLSIQQIRKYECDHWGILRHYSVAMLAAPASVFVLQPFMPVYGPSVLAYSFAAALCNVLAQVARARALQGVTDSSLLAAAAVCASVLTAAALDLFVFGSLPQGHGGLGVTLLAVCSAWMYCLRPERLYPPLVDTDGCEEHGGEQAEKASPH